MCGLLGMSLIKLVNSLAMSHLCLCCELEVISAYWIPPSPAECLNEMTAETVTLLMHFISSCGFTQTISQEEMAAPDSRFGEKK